MDLNQLRFAILGCGRIAHRHAKQIARVGVLIAVCDVDADRAVQFGKEFSVPVYHCLTDLLNAGLPLDILVVCTPNGLHAEHSIVSMRAGLHVICEKPMALHVRDCAEMMKTAEKYERHLFIVKQNRFNPPVLAVRNLIDQGRLGKINSVQLNCFWNRDADYYRSEWKGTLELDGGILFTQFSHFIDLLLWFTGDVHTVQAICANYTHQGLIEFEDTGVVLLEFLNGAMGTLHFTINSFKKNMEGSLTLFGEKGTVKMGGQYLNELEYLQMEGIPLPELEKGNPANEYGNYSGSMSNHDKFYDNLMAVLGNKGQKSASAEEGMKTVGLIERIYTSCRNRN